MGNEKLGWYLIELKFRSPEGTGPVSTSIKGIVDIARLIHALSETYMIGKRIYQNSNTVAEGVSALLGILVSAMHCGDGCYKIVSSAPKGRNK